MQTHTYSTGADASLEAAVASGQTGHDGAELMGPLDSGTLRLSMFMRPSLYCSLAVLGAWLIGVVSCCVVVPLAATDWRNHLASIVVHLVFFGAANLGILYQAWRLTLVGR